MHFLRFYVNYFLLRMHFVDFSRHCFGSFLADWRRSWWDQSWEACLECHCDTFDRDRCMNSLRYWWMSICSRSMLWHSIHFVVCFHVLEDKQMLNMWTTRFVTRTRFLFYSDSRTRTLRWWLGLGLGLWGDDSDSDLDSEVMTRTRTRIWQPGLGHSTGIIMEFSILPVMGTSRCHRGPSWSLPSRPAADRVLHVSKQLPSSYLHGKYECKNSVFTISLCI